MSSHQLAIAKASFTAALLRPDPTCSPCSRGDIEQFFTLFNAAIQRCSPTNIQNCKRWILGNLANSTARFTALGKYLTTLASTRHESSTRPSPRRKCLYILYLLNDILHHAKVHSNDASISSKLQPCLVALFSAAASFKNKSRHDQKIQELLDIWAEKGYYSTDYISKLREAVKTSSESEQASTDFQTSEQGNGESSKTTSRAAPFVMPAIHGDQSTPWYDLPAANLMPHIVPNSTRPIRPEQVKPLQFLAGPADENLTNAVKKFLLDVDEIYGMSNDDAREISWDVDELGQQIYLDENTGEVIQSDAYYGWSKEFCENMRKKRKGLVRGRSRSRSSSMSSSDGGNGNSRSFKRRRRSSDSYSSRSRSRSRSRSKHRGYKPSRSISRSRSRSSDERFPIRSESHPQPNAPPPPPPPQNNHALYAQQPFQGSVMQPPPHFAPIAPPFGPNGMIPPPPPPVGYNGTWPPAPPPQFVPQPVPYGQPNQNWPQAPQFHAPQPWQQNPAPTGPGAWNGMQPQYPQDGRPTQAWNGPPARSYYNQYQQNQGYGQGPPRGRGNFRGRGRG